MDSVEDISGFKPQSRYASAPAKREEHLKGEPRSNRSGSDTSQMRVSASSSDDGKQSKKNRVVNKITSVSCRSAK